MGVTPNPNHPARLRTTEKRCFRCERTLASTKFWLSNNSKDGLDCTCSECRNLGFNPRDAGKHKCLKCNRWLPVDRFYRRHGNVAVSPCKECRQARMRVVQSTPEFKEWRKKYILNWQRSNKDKVRASAIRRHARKLGAPVNDMTPKQWAEILEYHGNRCAYCLESGVKLEQDHVIPLSKGGSHTSENVVPACRSCNAKKHNNPVFMMAGGQ